MGRGLGDWGWEALWPPSGCGSAEEMGQLPSQGPSLLGMNVLGVFYQPLGFYKDTHRQRRK